MPFSDADARWVIATGNAGKLSEFRSLLAPRGLTLVSMQELGITEPPETGQTFVENALLKARHTATAAGLPAIADDSGLCVAGLGGEPGLHSARFAGSGASRKARDEANVALLLERLANADRAARAASFVCVIVALRRADDPDPIIATGRWHGRITTAPRGNKGFGYDPVFEIPALGKTAAELDQTSKSTLSHRGQATRQLLEYWTQPAAAPD